jgi:dTDP-4-amino-4,6-dideoxygalactose transaminase
MTCSATAPMVYSAFPVFADIEKNHFCLDPKSIEKRITKKTKAIIVVDLFGQPYEVEKINKIAKKHNLFVIEDSAQALGAKYNGNQAGTFGDIGCFSFTQGKHCTCGEGGFIVTKDYNLYMKCALIRNHAEAVIDSMPNNVKYYFMENQYGFNMRMTEMQAIVLIEQLKYLNKELELRKNNVNKIKELIKIDGIKFCDSRPNSEHSYYVLPFLYDEKKIGISRNIFIDAVKSELTISRTEMGITSKIDALIWHGYIKPIYKMPIFNMDLNFSVVEDLQNNKFCMMSYHALPLSSSDIQDIADAFYKVYDNREELK